MGVRLPILVAAMVAGQALAEGDWPQHALLRQAEQQCAERVKLARDRGARVELTGDGKSFHVLWLPKGADPANPPPMVVTLHGHGSWAFDEFFLWHKAAQERGYGILALQWWLGQGERFQDYLTPREVFRDEDETLIRLGARPARNLFHGFSRGSANACAVVALDRQAGKNWFALAIANAGKPGLDFPPNRDMDEGRFGPRPLEGTHWVTFAGGKDPHPDRDGIAGMREAAGWIRKHGGTVDRALEDPSAGHGGFHRSPANMDAALRVFQERLRGAPPGRAAATF